MASRLLRVVNLEVREQQPPVDVHRIKTINVVALFAIFFNVLYSILYPLRWQGPGKTSSRLRGHYGLAHNKTPGPSPPSEYERGCLHRSSIECV